MSDTVPYLAIGGVPLDCEAFAWPLAAGTVSPRVAFEVGPDVDRQLQALANPVTLEGRIAQTVGGKEKVFSFAIQALHLTERQVVDYPTVRWVLCDARILFEQVRVSGWFNVPRAVNEFAVPALPNPGGGNQNPDFNAIAQYRYRPNTLRDPAGLRFATPGGPVGRPWTALQAAQYLIGVVNTRHRASIVVVAESSDNGYQFPGGEPVDEERFPFALARMLSLARAGLYVAHDGRWVIYALQDEPLTVAVGGYDSAGLAEVRDISRLVPAAVNLRVPQEYEIRFDFYEPYGATAGRFDWLLENVLPLPESVTNVGSYVRGQWVPVTDGTDAAGSGTAIAIWNADTANPWSNGKALTLADVRKLMTSSALLFAWAFNPAQGGLLPVQAGRIAALMTYYRRAFRIPAIWLNLIEGWRPYLVNIIDAVTGTRAPSTVWTDYTVLPVVRPPERNADAAKKLSATHRAWGDTNTANVPPLKDGQIAPARVSVLSQELGVLGVDFYPDLQHHVLRYVHSALTKDVQVDLLKSPLSVAWLLENSAFAADFHLSTLISVSFSTPNGSERFFEVRSQPDAAGAGARPPAYDIFFTREPARWQWVDGSSTAIVDGRTGQVTLKGFRLQNAKILGAIAQAYQNRLAFSFLSRIQGVFRRMGYDPAVDRPRGNIKAVSPALTVDGAFETTYDMTEPPPAPDLYEYLPTDVRRIIFRELRPP